ncbi:MAG: hypothetical protein HZA89_12800 [Verrucomicrobia bacterium]|nr:hypothetical protein [Verrucomicrobiota bacterium]
MKKKIIFALLAISLGLLAPLLLAEIVLRFLPVYSGMKLMPLNDTNPILRFTPNQKITWSKGWNFELVNQLRINNDGFVNDQDYEARYDSPLFAVVGDSYIEAAMIPYAETVQGRLAAAVDGRGRVYSFGKSGQPLTAYLIWAEHARKAYWADALMISVVGNDFDESLNKYKTTYAGHYYVEGPGGELELKRFDYHPSLLRSLGRQSALIRYLDWNCHIEGVLHRFTHRREKFVGNVSAKKGEQVLADSKRAVDAFFRDLPAKTGLPPEKIIFTVDGMRPHLYDAQTLKQAEGSFFDVLRQYFIEQARRRGHEVIDLQPLFVGEFNKSRQRFEYPNDAHWNSAGHAVVAAAVRQSRTFQSLFKPAADGKK